MQVGKRASIIFPIKATWIQENHLSWRASASIQNQDTHVYKIKTPTRLRIFMIDLSLIMHAFGYTHLRLLSLYPRNVLCLKRVNVWFALKRPGIIIA